MHSPPSPFSPGIHEFLYDNLHKLLIFLCNLNHSLFYCLLSFLGVTAVVVSSASVITYSMIPGTTWTCDAQIQLCLIHFLYGYLPYFSRACFPCMLSVAHKISVIPVLNNMNGFTQSSFLNWTGLHFLTKLNYFLKMVFDVSFSVFRNIYKSCVHVISIHTFMIKLICVSVLSF